jgi:hypothetical protein
MSKTGETYFVRVGTVGPLREVTFEEYRDAFNSGESVFVAYDPVEPSEEPADWAGWKEIGLTVDGQHPVFVKPYENRENDPA